MLHPTINELTNNGEINRYELALATAKCARKITDEYARQRDQAEKSLTGNKETDKPVMNMIDQTYRDEKAVKIAIDKIYSGEYTIVEHCPEDDPREKAEQAEIPESAIPNISFDEDEDEEEEEDEDAEEDDEEEDEDEDEDEGKSKSESGDPVKAADTASADA